MKKMRKGKKRSVDKEMVRTAGVGLYTKDELGEKLGLSASEIKKNKLADLEKTAAEDGIIDLQKKKEKSDFSFLVKNAEKSREHWNEYSKSAMAQGKISAGSNVADNMNIQLDDFEEKTDKETTKIEKEQAKLQKKTCSTKRRNKERH